MSPATHPHPQRVRDADGIPPGLDRQLAGQTKVLRFSGHFYAQPEIPYQVFDRLVNIIFASKDVYVAYDGKLNTIYVVDRNKRLSLGCLMNAELLDVEE